MIACDDLSKQTPCREFNVAQLTDHLMNSITSIGGAVGAEFPVRDENDPVERQIILAARPALDARHRWGLEGTIASRQTETPAKILAGILSIEFLVHAWDYAVATDQNVDMPSALSDYVLGLAGRIITPQGCANVGFDDPIAVPGDAGMFERPIAFTGRNPAG